ncbi:hypothetical protein AMECASPLE_009830 [Ameca splendens]|uniref:Uncharacterized protein n=1 Tax=Ameca splendens TaxID=208324 RepID=A0ABV0ZXP7_9TELE
MFLFLNYLLTVLKYNYWPNLSGHTQNFSDNINKKISKSNTSCSDLNKLNEQMRKNQSGSCYKTIYKAFGTRGTHNQSNYPDMVITLNSGEPSQEWPAYKNYFKKASNSICIHKFCCHPENPEGRFSKISM